LQFILLAIPATFSPRMCTAAVSE